MITSSPEMNKRQKIYAISAGLCFILTFTYSETAIECARNALSLCVKTIIPSLFPFMIISEIIVSSGLGDIIGKIFIKFFNKLFGISRPSVCAIVLGALCGFPIGAKVVLSLLDSDSIDKSEAEHLLTFCNNPSSSFLINIVGISLYSSYIVGIIFYIVTLLNSALIGILWNTLRSDRTCYSKIFTVNKNKAPIFTNAVSSSIPGILTICSYIIFFSVIMGCIEKIMATFHSSKIFSTCIYGLIELSGGINQSASLGNNIISVCISAFFVGWSGVSVHFQLISLCNGYNLNFKKYFVSKLIHGFLNIISIAIIYHFKPSLFSPIRSSVSAIYLPGLYIAWSKICFVFFIIAILIYVYRRAHKSTLSIIY